MDSSNLIETFESRRDEQDLFYKHRLNSADQLDCVFVEFEGPRELWAKGGVDNVCMFDTQHGTSSYDMKTGLFVTIDESGKTKILALSVLKSEDKPSFIWIFTMFALCFGSLPQVIFTDSDSAMFWALLECWPTVLHFMCIFHLWKNFFEHLRPLFIHHPTEWQVLARKFWKIAKDSDISARETFTAAFDDLVLYVVENTPDTPARVLVLAWLSELRERHGRWAAAWKWTVLTLGAHSTGPSEAVHSAVRN